jgi:2-iminobutanoate/2-iminopropanoate deaminase
MLRAERVKPRARREDCVERQCIDIPGRKPNPILSAAVRAGGLVFTAGTVGVDPATGRPAGDDIISQGRQALENIKAALEAAGTSMDNVVKVICYFTNLADRPAFNEIYKEYFKKGMPARTGIEVSSLSPGILIEIEAIATMPA